ncbi:MAG: hypothetical protein RBT42_15820 [Aquabacterium sp.]|jgi:hypothetical protein|uniref:hypothetical protein n=1 Tax=Aquabacterium sp. TaxID=1872578 RepID=UPI002A36E425|nr:hypothetical protein [Aquabacterium sp.]MDX9845201.1 hypothetical protein [Aquabacterium sp.]
MYNEEALRKLAEWEPVDSFDEPDCLQAIRRFVDSINQSPDLRALDQLTTYNNFEAIFVYAPAEVFRRQQADGQAYTRHPSLLLYFHHFSPIAAMGRSTWSETLRPDGSWSSRGYGGLDLSELLSIEELKPGPTRNNLLSALQQTPYQIANPAYFKQSAPAWFKPLYRSEGSHPWDRLFHLFFQFND